MKGVPGMKKMKAPRATVRPGWRTSGIAERIIEVS